jgi:hypothetical protein
VQGLRFAVHFGGMRIEGLWAGVKGLGFGDQGLVLRVSCDQLRTNLNATPKPDI